MEVQLGRRGRQVYFHVDDEGSRSSLRMDTLSYGNVRLVALYVHRWSHRDETRVSIYNSQTRIIPGKMVQWGIRLVHTPCCRQQQSHTSYLMEYYLISFWSKAKVSKHCFMLQIVSMLSTRHKTGHLVKTHV